MVNLGRHPYGEPPRSSGVTLQRNVSIAGERWKRLRERKWQSSCSHIRWSLWKVTLTPCNWDKREIPTRNSELRVGGQLTYQSLQECRKRISQPRGISTSQCGTDWPSQDNLQRWAAARNRETKIGVLPKAELRCVCCSVEDINGIGRTVITHSLNMRDHATSRCQGQSPVLAEKAKVVEAEVERLLPL